MPRHPLYDVQSVLDQVLSCQPNAQIMANSYPSRIQVSIGKVTWSPLYAPKDVFDMNKRHAIKGDTFVIFNITFVDIIDVDSRFKHLY